MPRPKDVRTSAPTVADLIDDAASHFAAVLREVGLSGSHFDADLQRMNLRLDRAGTILGEEKLVDVFELARLLKTTPGNLNRRLKECPRPFLQVGKRRFYIPPGVRVPGLTLPGKWSQD